MRWKFSEDEETPTTDELFQKISQLEHLEFLKIKIEYDSLEDGVITNLPHILNLNII